MAAFVYAGLIFVLLPRFSKGSGRFRLLAVLVAGALWAAGLAVSTISALIPADLAYYPELVADAAWIVFLSAFFSGAVGTSPLLSARNASVVIVAAMLVAGLALDLFGQTFGFPGSAAVLLIPASVVTSLLVMYLLEQIYRNCRESQQRAARFICLGVGGIFLFDLFMYTHAILSGEISELLFSSRGYVAASFLPVFAYGFSRLSGSFSKFFVSRKVIGYSATLVTAGLYFLIVGLLGSYLSSVGGRLGLLAQVIGICVAVLLFVLLLFSRRLRSTARVLISKHFYEHKYDYREEWLQLIRTLSDRGDLPAEKRGIKALAQILHSESGWLWLMNEQQDGYECSSGWNARTVAGRVPAAGELNERMQTQGWIVDLHEERSAAERCAADAELLRMLENCGGRFAVPLKERNELIGFVVVASSGVPVELTYEDLDLLKTVSYQVAGYLAQEAATERLAESRQFEAVNRLSTYLMHDLKNLVAQQSLIVENARRHRRDPVFVDDAIDTIANSVQRMRHILRQLGRGGQPSSLRRTNLKYAASNAVDQCLEGKPSPELVCDTEEAYALVDSEQLASALRNLIINSQDATPPDGKVTVSVSVNADGAPQIDVVDSGSGMSEDFIRNRLFKPFDSTKGARGMGVGVYQAREYVRAVGGELSVLSEPEAGTTMRMLFPAAPEGAPRIT
ncbi:MAG: XrtA/PEP-CTERM system histidine kinase PrsK [Pseudomonadota bacterium]